MQESELSRLNGNGASLGESKRASRARKGEGLGLWRRNLREGEEEERSLSMASFFLSLNDSLRLCNNDEEEDDEEDEEKVKIL